MISINSIGLLSDIMIDKNFAEISEKNGYICVKSPDFLEYFWGNYLILSADSPIISAEEIFAAFGAEFAGMAGINHALVCSDIGYTFQKHTLETLVKSEFKIEYLSVLRCDNLGGSSSTKIPVQIRPLASERDWAQAAALHVLVDSEFNTTAFNLFSTKLYLEYRKIVVKGNGQWFGAFDGEKLVASLGIGYDDFKRAMVRFQAIETHPDYRRNGLCRALILAAANFAQNIITQPFFIIMAEPDSIAEKVYRSTGFERIELLTSALKQPITAVATAKSDQIQA